MPPPVQVNQTMEKRTAIFMDWDDTLLCSSHLSSEGLRLDSCESAISQFTRSQLKDLEVSVIKVLNLAFKYGDVYVITNAETGWVQLSCKKFMPGVLPLLDKLNIFSARSTFEPMFPDDPFKWKYCAFQEQITRAFPDSKHFKNILSFGDSNVEREAVRSVTRGLERVHTKNIKFAERPSIEQLRREIELVHTCFQHIFSHDGDLDLCMHLNVQDNPSEQGQDQGQGQIQGQDMQQQTESGKNVDPSKENCPKESDDQKESHMVEEEMKNSQIVNAKNL